MKAQIRCNSMSRPGDTRRFGCSGRQYVIAAGGHDRRMANPSGGPNVVPFVMQGSTDLDRSFQRIRIQDLVRPEQVVFAGAVIDIEQPVVDGQAECGREVLASGSEEPAKKVLGKHLMTVMFGKEGSGQDPAFVVQQADAIRNAEDGSEVVDPSSSRKNPDKSAQSLGIARLHSKHGMITLLGAFGLSCGFQGDAKIEPCSRRAVRG
ncbi:MAG: hypothetical protein ACMVO3_06350 [Thalassobaculum sp.]